MPTRILILGTADIVVTEDPFTGEPIIQLVQTQHDPLTGEKTQIVTPLPQNTNTPIGIGNNASGNTVFPIFLSYPQKNTYQKSILIGGNFRIY